MENVIVIYGGKSVEFDISKITGKQVFSVAKNLTQYKFFLVEIDEKNNFYLIEKSKRRRVIFEDKKMIILGFKNITKKIKCVINCCHGGIGENGELKAFFDVLNIPLSSSNPFYSMVCMNKLYTKYFLEKNKINVVKYEYFDKNIVKNDENLEKIKNLGKNVIIKPVSLGSSIGVFKTDFENSKEYILQDLELDKGVIVETAIEKMKEINCAVFQDGENIILGELENPIKKDEILSFNDKYTSGKKCKGMKGSDRIIPAKISKKLKQKIEEISKFIYQNFELSGVIRIDYIIDEENNQIYLNEINTVPGSLAYYLFEGLGIDFVSFIEKIIDNAKVSKNSFKYLKTLN